MLPDRSTDACNRKRPKASGDYAKQETKPRDLSKKFLWIWSDAARRGGRQDQKWSHQAVLSSLTYDDVRLARAGAGVGAKVALDLVGGLIEQIQVVFHWVSIVKALAQTDNTWCRGRRRLYPSSMLIYWNEPLWRLLIFVGNISTPFLTPVLSSWPQSSYVWGNRHWSDPSDGLLKIE